jgi:hypothetical protein
MAFILQGSDLTRVPGWTIPMGINRQITEQFVKLGFNKKSNQKNCFQSGFMIKQKK